MIPAAVSAGEGLESLTGGFSVVVSDQARAMRGLPKVDAVTPVPSFYKPSEQEAIFLFCEAEVANQNRPVRQVKGSFLVELYLLDHKTGRFDTFVVGSGKTKADGDGYGSFHVNVEMTPFAGRLQSEAVSAWFRTRGSFAAKKGDYAGLVCFASVSG